MPTNWLADKLLSEAAKTRSAAGVIRRVRHVDVNNVAASLEQQTRGLSGGNKSAQGAVAARIVQQSLQRLAGSGPKNTSSAGAGSGPKNTGAGSGSEERSGQTSRPSVLQTYVSRKIIGGQLVEITTTVLLVSGKVVTQTSTRVIGQANRPR